LLANLALLTYNGLELLKESFNDYSLKFLQIEPWEISEIRYLNSENREWSYDMLILAQYIL